MLRAVFDTNILFSATGWRGSPYHCLALARRGKITLVLAREILAEYHEKLQTRLGMTPAQATRAVAELLSCTTLVDIKNELRLQPIQTIIKSSNVPLQDRHPISFQEIVICWI